MLEDIPILLQDNDTVILDVPVINSLDEIQNPPVVSPPPQNDDPSSSDEEDSVYNSPLAERIHEKGNEIMLLSNK